MIFTADTKVTFSNCVALILYNERVEKKLKQYKVAGDLNWQATKLCRMEKGLSKIDLNDLNKLCEYYNIDIQRVINDARIFYMKFK
jgi:transcriptional regulator with XRE-family HTH domain